MSSPKQPPLQRTSIIVLQIVLVLIGMATLTFLLVEPHFEGRNVNATLFEIYFRDPFLAYAYLSSVPFFVALVKAFALLTNIARGNVFTPQSVRALRAIKYCALLLIACVAGAEAYFFLVQRAIKEDIAGGVAMGMFVLLVSVVIATAAAVFEALLQSAVAMKSEQDLTI